MIIVSTDEKKRRIYAAFEFQVFQISLKREDRVRTGADTTQDQLAQEIGTRTGDSVGNCFDPCFQKAHFTCVLDSALQFLVQLLRCSHFTT